MSVTHWATCPADRVGTWNGRDYCAICGVWLTRRIIPGEQPHSLPTDNSHAVGTSDPQATRTTPVSLDENAPAPATTGPGHDQEPLGGS